MGLPCACDQPGQAREVAARPRVLIAVRRWASRYAPMVATGMGVLNGTTVGTDKVVYALWDSAGAVIRTTLLTGVLSATADVFQEIAFTSAVTLPPGRYWGGFQAEGTTAAHQTIATLTYLNSTGPVAGTFGTIPAITTTNTTTAGVGPFWYLYA